MSKPKKPLDEIQQLEQAITALETQRSLLGEELVEAALAPMLEKMAALKQALIPDSGPSAIAEAFTEAAELSADVTSLEEQRKLVTVLFADLVGFTAMSENLDPEDTREILNLYFSRWQTLIERHGGLVEKYVGDAVMAVYGIPASHESDSENAIRTALSARHELEELNRDLQAQWGIQLSMRIGIHTGPVVASFAGERKGQEFVVVGDTVNLASRLQSHAPSNGILISHATYRLARGIFDVQRLEPVQVKGKQEPIEVYVVLREKQRAFRAPTRGIEGIDTRLVGREAELNQLKDALTQAVQMNSPQILTMVGEAGIGKTRLMAEFDEWVELLPVVVRYYKGRAGPSMQNLPFSLLRDLFSFRFQIQDSDPPQVVQKKLVQGFSEALQTLTSGAGDEAVAQSLWIGELLGFQVSNVDGLKRRLEDPMQFRRQGQAYLRDYFKATAALRPVVLLLEDIHWADDSSLEVVEKLAADMAGEHFLVVCTARPTLYERLPGWGAAQGDGVSTPRHARLDVHPLTVEQSQSLVDEILQKAGPVPAALRNLVVDRAEGNPFFIEEFILMLMEEGAIQKGEERWEIHLDRLAGIQTPSTLTEVLQSRLDALPPEEKMLLQRASVIGRVFWDEAVSFLTAQGLSRPPSSERAMKAFARLNAREMIYERDESAFEKTREFTFRHALLRDVAYDGMLKRLRKVYHAYTARWLETVTERSQRAEEYAALIAEHYHLADEKERACVWYQRAGQHAGDHFSNAEALRFYNHAIELCPPEDLERRFDLLLDRIKLYDLLANRAAQFQDLEKLDKLIEKFAARQQADGEMERRKALLLIQRGILHEARGDYQILIQEAGEAAALARAGGDVAAEATARLHQGSGFWHTSDFQSAISPLEQGLDLAQAAGLRNLEADFLRNLGVVYQYLGKLAPARVNYESALEIYRELGHLRGQSMTFNSLGSLLFESGEYRAAQRYYEESLRIKRQVGHLRAEHITLQNLATLLSILWDYDKATRLVQQCRVFFSESGDRGGLYDVLGSLSDLLMRTGHDEQAREYLQQQQVFSQEYQDPYIELSAEQVKCQLELQAGNVPAALSHLERAQNWMQEIESPIEKVRSFNFHGRILLELGQRDASLAAFKDSLSLAGAIQATSLIIEAQAGMAEAHLSLGDMEAAQASAESTLASLQKGEGGELDFMPLEGIADPIAVLLHLIRVFETQGDERGLSVLHLADRLLAHITSMMEDPAMRDSYLSRVSSVQKFQEIRERLGGG